MTSIRNNALGLLIAALLLLLVYLAVVQNEPSLPVQAPHPSSSLDRSYPGCSFDGDFSNDKPGACPNSRP